MAVLDFTMDHMMRSANAAADGERLLRMSRAIKAYGDGMDDALQPSADGQNDNIHTNYCRMIADKGVSFLFGKDFKIEIGDPKQKQAGGEKDTRGEDTLEELWGEDQRAEDLIDLGTNGSCTGDVYAQIVMEDGAPSVAVLDPLNMTIEWDPINYRKVRRYINEFNTVDEHKRPVVRRQETVREQGRWVIRNFYSLAGKSGWTRDGDDIRWIYDFCPVVHAKNLPAANSVYGTPDLTLAVLRLNFYLNRVDSLINRIIRLHAHPKTIARNVRGPQGSNEIEIGADGVLYIDGGLEAELKNLEMQSDLTAAMNFRDRLRRSLAEISSVPEVTTETKSLGTLSGRAMQLLYGPLIDQTQKKQRLYGRLVKDIVRGLLTIKGLPEQAKHITLHWGSPLPADHKEAAEVAILKKQVGFSSDTLVRELGGDPGEEREKRKLDVEAAQDAFNSGAGGDVYGAGGGAEDEEEELKKAA